MHTQSQFRSIASFLGVAMATIFVAMSLIPDRGALARLLPDRLANAVGQIAPAEASAANTWPTPPRCVASQWVNAGGKLGLYSKAGEYTQKRFYGGGTEIRYIWVFYVEVPIYPYGMVSAGRAERHCGTRWVPGYA